MFVGIQFEYLKEEEIRSIACDLLATTRTRITVRKIETDKRWTLPLHYLNIDHIATEFVANNKRCMSKAERYIGPVIKLNTKRAVLLAGNEKWQVTY